MNHPVPIIPGVVFSGLKALLRFISTKVGKPSKIKIAVKDHVIIILMNRWLLKIFIVIFKIYYLKLITYHTAAGKPLKGVTDHYVPVLSVKDIKGNLIAILFGYACHPTTFLSRNLLLGDCPGLPTSIGRHGIRRYSYFL